MSDNKYMTIRLQPDGFLISEAGLEPAWHAVAPGADFSQRMSEALLDAGIAEHDAEQVQVVVGSCRVSLSPANISEAEAEAMYALSLSKAPYDEVLLSDICGDVRFTYGMAAQLYHFVRRTLPEAELVHPLALLANNPQLADAAPAMLVEAESSAINLLAFKNGKIVLANRVQTDSVNNQAYFVLTAWVQLGFDTLTDTLHLSVLPPCQGNELREVLGTYVKDIKTITQL